MPPATPKPDTDGRLSTLEEGQRSQGREISGLRQDFQAFAAEIRHALAERSRFPWPAIAVIVSILGGLITLGAWGPLREQERQALEINALSDKAERVAVSRFDSDDGDDMEAGFSTALTRQESRLMRYTDLVVRALQIQVDQLRKDHEHVSEKVDAHQSDGHPGRVEAIARGGLEALESRVRALEQR